jgi:hypothetical protein
MDERALQSRPERVCRWYLGREDRRKREDREGGSVREDEWIGEGGKDDEDEDEDE